MRQSCNEVVQADYFIILSLSTSYSGQCLAYRTLRGEYTVWDFLNVLNFLLEMC